MVVLSILVVQSIINMGPIIFLRLAEKQSGQVDAIFSNHHASVKNFDNFDDNEYYLNYTEVDATLTEAGVRANLSPRIQ